MKRQKCYYFGWRISVESELGSCLPQAKPFAANVADN